MSFVGPSYHLNHRDADVQRSVNLFPVVNETPGGKNFAYMESVPGLTAFSGGNETGFILLEDGAYLNLED